MQRAPIEIRFWYYVLPVESGCWEWQGGLNNHGYGMTSKPGFKHLYSHRVAYELCTGEIPAALCVLHTCDNPACVNPGHLVLGTMKDNTQDMLRKDRDRNGNKGRTHCKRGHEFTSDNTYLSKGKRSCRTCSLDWQRANKRKVA